LWKAKIEEWVGNKPEVAAYLQRLIGYAITGMSNEPLFAMLVGEGRNGKTIFIEIIKEVMGDYMSPIPADLLLDQGKYQRNADSPTPTIMSLRGLRIAYASETDENRSFSTSRVKWLTGGDRLVGRYPWDRDPTSFIPSHALFLLTNHKPRAKGHEQAFWDRVRLIPFPFRYVDSPSEKVDYERQRDPELIDKLRREMPGILAWMVEGCLLYQRDKLIQAPEEVMKATREYQRGEDDVRDFVEVCLVPAPGKRINATDLHDLYLAYYEKEVGGKPYTKTYIGRLLSYILRKKERVGGKIYYLDWDIKPEAWDQYPPKKDRKD
jgi:putative DNA primase/helicase